MKKNKKILNEIVNFIIFLTGITITSIAVNVFFIPNNFISSGLTGIAVIISNISEMTPFSVIFFGNMMLIGISIITLGMEKTSKYIIGALLFILMVYLTEDINQIFNIKFDNIILYVIAAGVGLGVGEGLTFKAGYSGGGTSLLALILNKYLKRPIGDIVKAVGTIIIVIGGFIFGYTNLMYSVIIIYISTLLINKITIGISDSKMILIYTCKELEVVDYIMNYFHNGVTKINSQGVFTNKKKNLLMCVVATDKYTSLVMAVKAIDQQAFISVSDCYEVYGGTKRNKLPFIDK